MYISWGTKVFRKSSGIAAEFCPICRCPTVADMEEVRSQPHVYHIGIGDGKVVGHMCRCQKCRSEWVVQAGTIRFGIHPASFTTLNDLVEHTFPRFPIVHGERLRQEEIIQHDPLSLPQQTRLTLIAEPFFVLENDVVANEKKDSSWESNVGTLGCLGSLALAVCTLVAFCTGAPLVGTILIFLTVGLSWLVMRLLDMATRKYMRKSIYPRLASCLAPLRPTQEELTAVIANVNVKCAKKTNLQDFLPILEDARRPGGTTYSTVLPPPRMY